MRMKTLFLARIIPHEVRAPILQLRSSRGEEFVLRVSRRGEGSTVRAEFSGRKDRETGRELPA